MTDQTGDSFDEPTVITELGPEPEAAPPAASTADATSAGAARRPSDPLPDAPTMVQPAVEAPDAAAATGGAIPDDTTPDQAADTSASAAPHRTAQVRAGDVFAGRYRLEQQLAQRGGTLTWRAFDQKLSRSVLVHILAPGDPRTEAVLDAARQAAVATDSRFLRVLDAVGGDDPTQPAMVVCEYAPGQSLEQLLAVGPLSTLEAAWVVRELCDAMGAMHEVGLFHQRLNPDTVIITATGNVKIVGFLIEAALHPEEADRLPWAQRESADVRALGKLLYASLVSRWPADSPGDNTWGLPAAPTDARGWVMPRQLDPSVSPALEAICDQVLSATPRLGEAQLTSSKQVAQALSRVLGTADAASDLERRMRFPMTPVRPSTAAAVAAASRAVGAASGSAAAPDGSDPEATAQWDAPAHFAREDAAAAASGATAVAGHDASDADAPGSATNDDAGSTREDADGSGAGGAGAAVRQRLRRWRGRDESDDGRAQGREGQAVKPNPTLRDARKRPTGRAVDAGRHRIAYLLVGLVLLSLVVGLISLFTHRATSGSSTSGSTTSATASGSVLAIASAKDFDPTADGGNGTENPGEVALAHDGNDATAWQTVTYLNSAKLGKLKPGVGLVLDLGSSQSIGQVKLVLQGHPTAVQVMVPSAANATTAPMTTEKSWRTVASNAAAGTSVTLTPTSATTSRYVLVYLTSLPSVGTNKYRGGIAEVQVLS